jgi:hypothetical protein
MKLVKQNGVFIAVHTDVDKREYLRAVYGSDITFHWIADDTPVLPDTPGTLKDSRLLFSEEVVRLCIRQDIDDRTDELIDNGVIYSEIQFRTDVKHQNQYMFSYLLNQAYPYTVKGIGQNYLTFQNRTEHTAFIGTCFASLEALLKAGWTLKDALDEMTTEEMLAWVDPR